MPDLKISELSVATPLDGTELVPVVQGGTTKRMPASALWAQELGYAEKATVNETTSNNLVTDADLMNNLIAGLTVVVVGTGRPVDVEIGCSWAANNTAGKTCYLVLMINGSQVGGMFPSQTSGTANKGTNIYGKRRLVLTNGVQYTFQVAKFVDSGTTGTYNATPNAPLWLGVTQR